MTRVLWRKDRECLTIRRIKCMSIVADLGCHLPSGQPAPNPLFPTSTRIRGLKILESQCMAILL